MDGPPSPAPHPLPWTELKENVGILKTICAYAGKQELITLAVSFKAISTVALDELWRSMEAFYPLLHILGHAGMLSSTTHNKFPSSGVQEHLTFVRNLSPAWERFVQYANRIESFHLGVKDIDKADAGHLSRDVHVSTVVKLGQLVARTPTIFQRLRCVEINSYKAAAIVKAFSYAPLIVGPSLESITIVCQGPVAFDPIGDLAQLYLTTVVEANCPMVQLNISSPRIPSHHIIFETISQIRQVCEIKLGTIYCLHEDPMLWLSQIGSLPTLRRLSLRIEPLSLVPKQKRVDVNVMAMPAIAPDNENANQIGTLLPGPPERGEQSLFPSLQYCQIEGSSTTVRQALSMISSKILTGMVLVFRERSAPDLKDIDTISCLDILGTKRNLQDSLECLDLSVCTVGEPSSPLGCPAQFLNSLRHLRCLKKLRVVTPIENLGKFIYTVRSLSELEDLNIPISGDRKFNIQTLRSLATACPRLRQLLIPIDTSPGNIPQLPWDVSVLNHGLRELRTNEGGSWTMTEHLLAARHINALFPKLEVLEGGDGWDAVRTIVQMIRDVARRQG
ncbi:hypothetical protein BKA70DRAFT_1568155 [Coprinopsis sp. MPI-PUGE-AT-0042]|nr:hypothetical protein BKA70DRAFT_1568155 [Coprinopsis sp. MPI-PUGE-AT-0042]